MLRNKLETNPNSIWQRMHIDLPLLLGLLLLMGTGLVVIYSAGGKDIDLIIRQGIRLAVALGVMLLLAQIPPLVYRRLSIHFYVLGVLMLVAVLLFGTVERRAAVAGSGVYAIPAV